MNSLIMLRRLGFLFTLLCLTAVAVHPGAAAAAAHSAPPTAPAPPAAPPKSAAPTQDDHAMATPPPATDDAFDDDSDRDSSDWRSRICDGRVPSTVATSHVTGGAVPPCTVAV